jgi:hypothetical protein
MFGGVVPLKALHQFPRFFRGDGLVKRSRRVNIEIVLDQNDLGGSGVDIFRQDPQGLGIVQHGPLPGGSDLDLTPSFHRSIPHEGGDTPATDVFVVLLGDRSGLGKQAIRMMVDQLFDKFIETDQRAPGIARTLVNLQNIFHRSYECGIGFWRNTPPFYQPGFEFVFFKACRTVSGEILWTTSSSTNFPAKSFRVRRAQPGGGSRQAIWTKRAS